jgi:hypothetical protein
MNSSALRKIGSITYNQALTRRRSLQSMTASGNCKIDAHLSNILNTLNDILLILNVYNNGLEFPRLDSRFSSPCWGDVPHLW